MPKLEFFITLELECNPDVFFEVLVMGIKNELMSQQANYFKLRSVKKKTLLSADLC